MKKISMGLLLALCAIAPVCGAAEGTAPRAPIATARPALPDFIGPIERNEPEAWTAVPASSKGDAATQGEAAEAGETAPEATQPETESAPQANPPETDEEQDAWADGEQTADLTLDLSAASGRVDEGKSVTVTITAGNPLPEETRVSFSLALPQGLTCAQGTAWEAALPAATTNERGERVPSVTAFTREVTFAEGGEGAQAELTVEMGMGARFYRAQTALELCVSDVRVTAQTTNVEDGRVRPGDAFGYEIEVANAGFAAREVPLEMILPEGLSVAGELPEGFALTGSAVRGSITAKAAGRVGAMLSPSRATVTIPVRVEENALDGDEDALRMLSGVLRADGERLPLPRVQVCGPMVTAKLIPQADRLEAGARMNLRIVVANTGLAPADVRVSCMLPQGLTLAQEPHEDGEDATPEEAAKALPPQDGGAQAAVLLTPQAEAPVPEAMLANGTLVYALHMDAASEGADGVTAATQVIDVPVQAEKTQEALRERLVGASLAWSVEEDTQLGEAVAVRVYTPSFLGIAREEWSGIFWATLLLVVTVACLYAAVRAGDDDEDIVLD